MLCVCLGLYVCSCQLCGDGAERHGSLQRKSRGAEYGGQDDPAGGNAEDDACQALECDKVAHCLLSQLTESYKGASQIAVPVRGKHLGEKANSTCSSRPCRRSLVQITSRSVVHSNCKID